MNFLVEHWKKEWQVFHENFKKLSESSNPDTIHDLRVAVKKLRSYHKFYSNVFEESNSPLFIETEKLFSVLGKQRNVEICLELLGQLNYLEKLPGLHRHLKIYLAETELRSKLALNSYTLDDLNALGSEIEQTILLQSEEMILEKGHAIVKSSIDEAQRHMHKFEESFHLARKKLKDLFYWTKMSPVHFYFSTSQVKDLDDSLDLLGKIQDNETLRSYARNYRRNFLVKGEIEFEMIKELENLCKGNMKTMLEKVEKMLKNLLGKD